MTTVESKGSPANVSLRPPFKTILCPTDISTVGNLPVPVAYRLAGEGSTVHLLHVCEPPHLGNPLYGQYVQGYVPTEEEIQAGRDRAKNSMHRLAPDDSLEQGIRTEYHLVEGTNPANVIEEVAREIGVDIVVMGTHGRTGLGRLLMGSVATDVVKKDALPVILVHQDFAEED